ncbi:DUF2339 domain-containing protein [Actinomyces sp. ZJ308]|uniref:DUF2339 domain-containing protein n=1 Tax=Actinomyces sp. ZJ308 TaxID=2708342 RepID=UPI001422C144|nr:DUF2339 domain-containing protein [Actinomyces sp. ZJ308]
MPTPPNAGPNITLLLQRLDLIEKKIDWVAQRVTWLTYTAGGPARAEGGRPMTERSTYRAPSSAAAETGMVVTDVTHDVTDVSDDVAVPRPSADSPTAVTSPLAGSPATSTIIEVPHQDLPTPPSLARIVEDEAMKDEETGRTAPVQSSDSPGTPESEQPTAQRHEEPSRIAPEHSAESWTSPGSTGHAPAPSTAVPGPQSFQEEPAGRGIMGATDAGEIPSWVQRTVREGNLGRYLLSGAAAVLVLSAGVSLLALVWDSIPDPVKILALALIAVAMTAAGARLGTSRPRYRVAAATITGTGGGLGFVSIVGAVLLDGMFSPEPALGLMACWGLVLLVVSHLTRVLFTAVVSTIGALVTIGFAVNHVTHQPSSAIVTWLMIGVYVAVLALTCGFLSRGTQRMRLAAWYPVTSLAATVVALVFAPIRPMLRISPVGGTATVMALCLLLVCQTMHASRGLWSTGVRAAGWDWALAAAALLVAYRNLLTEQVGLELTHSAVIATFILELLLLAVAALASLIPHSPDPWRSAMAIGHEASFFPFALVGMAIVNDPRVYLFVVVTAMLCFLPAVVGGRVEPAPILALLGTAPILTLPDIAYSRAEILSLITAVAVSVLLVAVTEGLGDRAARSMPAPAPAPSQVQPRLVALRLALAAIVFNLAVLTPFLARGLVNDSPNARAGLHMVPGLVLIAFIALGAFSSGATPLRVLSGQSRGARYRVGPHGEALPDPHSSLAGAPAPSWIVSGIIAISATVTLSWAEDLTSTAWTLALVAVALGLGAGATWILLPWGRRTEVCLSLAVGNSLLMWLSVMVATSIGPGSVLMSVLVLLTGGACIVFGFKAHLTILRHYGLTLVLLSVLKLAAVDAASQNSMIRVISLAAAGIICFILSLLYNRYAQEQHRERAKRAEGRSRP